MDSPPPPSSSAGHGTGESVDGAVRKGAETLSQVDPFLVEALENPRHRLTVLRMEMDVQRFLQSSDQYQFEFQHFPSSYLRRAAHRVAQHYGLQTLVLDGAAADGKARILAPSENGKPAEKVKIVIRARPAGAAMGGAAGNKKQQDFLKTVEEREEEYDKARARIFNEFNAAQRRRRHQRRSSRRIVDEPDRSGGVKDGSARVAAIFRDREKDRTDPDYDRSYGSQSFNVGLYHGLQPSHHSQYELGFPQLRQMQSYQPSGHVLGSHFYAAGCNQPSGDAIYVPPCPSPTMIYAHSYEHFRSTVFQGPFCQQPLSFEQQHYR
ncbi:unnamed protein product [Spirodela intermedia]|uniref:Uncharacterized protein n=1 Tax=Spirodela intermedia TaxID=51605 RepID=A0A7I8IY89_SPIIN|nr:unnamed protein product [Spirodela intermedia]CAA6661971.1 unnamed protein product [Spirodela intermedia]